MLNSTFRQLEVFLEFVASGSFAQAAERLDISQPAVSRHFKALENQCGGHLITRKAGQKSDLTELGLTLLRHAPSLVANARTLSTELAEARGYEMSRPIRVTGHPYVMEHLIRPILAEFTAINSKMAVEVVPYSAEVMQQRAGMSSADVAFVSVDAVDEADVEILKAMNYGLLVGANHPFARQTVRSAADIAHQPFILPLAGTDFERKVLQMLHAVGCDNVIPAARAQQADVIKDLVVRGVGIAHLPVDIVEAELANGSVKLLPVSVPQLYLGQIAGARVKTSALTRSLLAFARKTLGTQSKYTP
jgi:DNA-binding transcriptional LysR family regulator